MPQIVRRLEDGVRRYHVAGETGMLLTDLRYAARILRKSPLVTIAIIFTVALGIGANTAIFSVVNAVLLRPLPYEQPNRLVWVAERNDPLKLQTFAAVGPELPLVERAVEDVFPVGRVRLYQLQPHRTGRAEQFRGGTLSPSLLPLLGIRPILGRSFRDEEERPGAAKVVMISEALWKRRFGSDRSIVGRTLILNGAATTVVGVAPSALVPLSTGDMWVPLTIEPEKENRLNHVIIALGRLRPGVAFDQAQAEMDVVAGRVSQQYADMKDWGIRLVTLGDLFVNSQLRTALVVLLAAVGCVLLIASANVANLLLARAASRQKEIAVRTAIGASRARILAQLLIESFVLSAIGGLVGVMTALWSIGAINALLPPNLLPTEVSVDGTVLLFALALTIVTGLLFGIAPAWHAAKTDLNEALMQATRASSGLRPRLRNGLAAAELALATVLLIGAGLLAQSLLRLQQVNLGFQSDHLLTFQLALPANGYAPDQRATFYRNLLDSLQASPGVRAAAVSSGIPFGNGAYTTTPIMTIGPSPLPPEAAVPTDWRFVSPGYFKAMRIPLLRGREFADADMPSTAPLTVIVSQTTAQRFWGATDPIGRILHRQGDLARQYTVVGVVGDVRHSTLATESPPSITQASRSRLGWMSWCGLKDRRPRCCQRFGSGSMRSMPRCRFRRCARWTSGWPTAPRSRGSTPSCSSSSPAWRW
jgi:putative ABC transport system permease protein